MLAQHDMKVTILEGRDRVGGRVSRFRYKRRLSVADIHQVHQVSQQGHLIDLYILLLVVFRAKITDIDQGTELDSCETLTMMIDFDSQEADSFHQGYSQQSDFVSREKDARHHFLTS